MSKKAIKRIISEELPAAVGPYVHGSMINGILFSSGQLPIDPKTGKMSEGIEAQAKQSLENCRVLLAHEDMEMKDIVKTNIFMDDVSDFAKVNDIYAAYFEDGEYPARTAYEVGNLPLGALIEIEVIASKGN
ncbi:RidA family protein [Enterococcus sp. AZ103]|uniref:RidA family protein n=1 Tax=Enterococcus sp. AZ103 TaxID=2774628 RepID=UPI003F20A879